jgi:hypothetical protein
MDLILHVSHPNVVRVVRQLREGLRPARRPSTSTARSGRCAPPPCACRRRPRPHRSGTAGRSGARQRAGRSRAGGPSRRRGPPRARATQTVPRPQYEILQFTSLIKQNQLLLALSVLDIFSIILHKHQ